MDKEKAKKWILKIILAVYVVELVWFLYSEVISKLISGDTIDIVTIELAVVLVIGLIAIITFFILKRSKKVGIVVVGIIVASVLAFSILAPLFDAYLPIIWRLFGKGS
ncbi:hypothetical protein [Vagococcus sp.]|uniref:hypothetical protein n=1 Tax=Vagococcus sp. TaxID=1933889 RepID=UPI003F955CA1